MRDCCCKLKYVQIKGISKNLKSNRNSMGFNFMPKKKENGVRIVPCTILLNTDSDYGKQNRRFQRQKTHGRRSNFVLTKPTLIRTY